MVSSILTELPLANVNSKGKESGNSVSASRAATTAPASPLKVGPITAPLGTNLSSVCDLGWSNCLQALSDLVLE